ncbi:MAG: DM13 domain-containing protein [Actinomycetota bacterium]|nr:DM13 domain-containing protein [Actinomycetota bacterium]
MGATETDIARPGVALPDAGGPPPPPSPSPAHRAATSIGLLVLVASAVLGGNPFGLRERLMGSATPEARPAAASRAAGEAPVAPTMESQETVLRSQPWWQGVATLEGDGATNAEPFTIDEGAIQWRVTWSCESGALTVLTVTPGAGGSEPLVESACPGTGQGYGSDSGPTSLAIEADGPWQLQVEQQLDVPLVEPPTAAMTDPTTTVASTGSFYRMDQSGTGTVSIYRLDDGSHALRLDEFFVTPNVDLEIHLSPLEAPQTTEEFMSVPSISVAPLDVTAGSMNFVIPPEVDPAQYASVVIWCPLIDSAYAAANLATAS